MAQALVTDTYLSNLADAIRAKLGTEDTYTPAEMADAILSIGGGSAPEIVSWASGTDEQIAAMLDYAQSNSDFDLHDDGGWSVGDVRTITVGAFTGGNNVSVPQQSIDIVITSFDDYNSCGAVMQFDFKDQLSSALRMNSTMTNSGGYDSTEMYTTTLPALVNALPSWLKDRLIEFSCFASAGGGSSSIETVTGNKLALRSESEIYDSVSYSAVGEGSQIAYYTTSTNRIKKRGHSGSSSAWWVRSPKKTDGVQFCNVSEYGTKDYNGAQMALGVAPFGCL